MRMKLRNKIFGLMAVTGAALTVVGCSPSNPPSVASPITVEESAYSAFHVVMDNGLIVTCLEGGAYQDKTLTCFEGSQDYSDAIPVAETSYRLSYVDVGQGVTVACFEGGAYKDKVHTCFPYSE